MLSLYLNQDVTWKTRSSVDEYNQPTFSSSTIKGRFIYKRQMIRTTTGEEIQSNAILYTESAVEEGDVIVADSKDWRVRDVYPHRFFDGSIMGYKVVL